MAQRTSIDGLYELGHVLYALDADTNGFARPDIACVESFWNSGDMHSSSAGFVFRLHDGRRVYVDFLHWHGFEQDEDFRIEVDFLAADEAVPRPRGPAPWPPAPWSSDVARLDRVLAAGRA
jgi:hypothetical protein